MAETKTKPKKVTNKATKSSVVPKARVFSAQQLSALSFVVRYPLSTEKSLRAAEFENKLMFIVDIKTSKKQIKNAIEALFKSKVKSINTTITPQGVKKAYVKFDKSVNATDVATSLGML